jgi:hypothetical protein
VARQACLPQNKGQSLASQLEHAAAQADRSPTHRRHNSHERPELSRAQHPPWESTCLNTQHADCPTITTPSFPCQSVLPAACHNAPKGSQAASQHMHCCSTVTVQCRPRPQTAYQQRARQSRSTCLAADKAAATQAGADPTHTHCDRSTACMLCQMPRPLHAAEPRLVRQLKLPPGPALTLCATPGFAPECRSCCRCTP